MACFVGQQINDRLSPLIALISREGPDGHPVQLIVETDFDRERTCLVAIQVVVKFKNWIRHGVEHKAFAGFQQGSFVGRISPEALVYQ